MIRKLGKYESFFAVTSALLVTGSAMLFLGYKLINLWGKLKMQDYMLKQKQEDKFSAILIGKMFILLTVITCFSLALNI